MGKCTYIGSLQIVLIDGIESANIRITRLLDLTVNMII